MNNLFVLYGEEKFLIDLEIKKLIQEILGTEENEMIISHYDLGQTNVNEILTDAYTAPFLSDKKVIICDNCFFLTGSNKESIVEQDLDALLKYLDNANNDTFIIFKINNDKLDERKKIVKELHKKALVKEFNKLNNKDLESYVQNFFTKEKYKADNFAIRELINRVGNDLEILFQEINKLMNYKIEEKKINVEDVEILVESPVTDNIFELIEAVTQKNIEKSLNLYQHLLTVNEEPIKIIVMLANQFRLIYQTKKLYSLGYSEKDIATKLGVHPYRIKLANEVRLDERTLLTYLEELADLDIDIKTGKVNKDIGLEMFLLKI